MVLPGLELTREADKPMILGVALSQVANFKTGTKYTLRDNYVMQSERSLEFHMFKDFLVFICMCQLLSS